jgi:hypothetical protein
MAFIRAGYKVRDLYSSSFLGSRLPALPLLNNDHKSCFHRYQYVENDLSEEDTLSVKPPKTKSYPTRRAADNPGKHDQSDLYKQPNDGFDDEPGYYRNIDTKYFDHGQREDTSSSYYHR